MLRLFVLLFTACSPNREPAESATTESPLETVNGCEFIETLEVHEALFIRSPEELEPFCGVRNLDAQYLHIIDDDTQAWDGLSQLAALEVLSGQLILEGFDDSVSLPALRAVRRLDLTKGSSLSTPPRTPALVQADAIRLEGYEGTWSLPSLETLGSLDSTGGATVVEMAALRELHDITAGGSLEVLSASPELTRIEGNVRVIGRKLWDISFFERVTEIGGKLEIKSAESLTTLDAFASLTQVGALLPTATSYGNDSRVALIIGHNPWLKSIEGLASLKTVYGSMIVTDNAILPSLDGLHCIETWETTPGADTSWFHVEFVDPGDIAALKWMLTASLPPNCNLDIEGPTSGMSVTDLETISGRCTPRLR